jgi:hypothetical protein
MSKSLQALRRANPRAAAGHGAAVAAAHDVVRARIALVADEHTGVPRRSAASSRWASRRRRPLGAAAVGAAVVVVAAAATAFLSVGSPGRGPGVEDAAAAVTQAATVTAAAADESGTVVVRITHGGELWSGRTIRWHDGDVEISREEAPTPRPGSKMLVVDGIVYGLDARGRWINEGDQSHIDPDSGTTPAETLAAVREDIGGVTVQRLTGGMTGLTTGGAADGSTVYRGTVAAGLVARETGMKEGDLIRVLPFGHPAHGAAADPAAPLDAAVTVGADGIVREIAVAWGSGSSRWIYTVSYRQLGETPPIVAPANALSLLELRRRDAGEAD